MGSTSDGEEEEVTTKTMMRKKKMGKLPEREVDDKAVADSEAVKTKPRTRSAARMTARKTTRRTRASQEDTEDGEEKENSGDADSDYAPEVDPDDATADTDDDFVVEEGEEGDAGQSDGDDDHDDDDDDDDYNPSDDETKRKRPKRSTRTRSTKRTSSSSSSAGGRSRTSSSSSRIRQKRSGKRKQSKSSHEDDDLDGLVDKDILVKSKSSRSGSRSSSSSTGGKKMVPGSTAQQPKKPKMFGASYRRDIKEIQGQSQAMKEAQEKERARQLKKLAAIREGDKAKKLQQSHQAQQPQQQKKDEPPATAKPDGGKGKIGETAENPEAPGTKSPGHSEALLSSLPPKQPQLPAQQAEEPRAVPTGEAQGATASSKLKDEARELKLPLPLPSSKDSTKEANVENTPDVAPAKREEPQTAGTKMKGVQEEEEENPKSRGNVDVQVKVEGEQADEGKLSDTSKRDVVADKSEGERDTALEDVKQSDQFTPPKQEQDIKAQQASTAPSAATKEERTPPSPQPSPQPQLTPETPQVPAMGSVVTKHEAAEDEVRANLPAPDNAVTGEVDSNNDADASMLPVPTKSPAGVSLFPPSSPCPFLITPPPHVLFNPDAPALEKSDPAASQHQATGTSLDSSSSTHDAVPTTSTQAAPDIPIGVSFADKASVGNADSHGNNAGNDDDDLFLTFEGDGPSEGGLLGSGLTLSSQSDSFPSIGQAGHVEDSQGSVATGVTDMHGDHGEPTTPILIDDDVRHSGQHSPTPFAIVPTTATMAVTTTMATTTTTPEVVTGPTAPAMQQSSAQGLSHVSTIIEDDDDEDDADGLGLMDGIIDIMDDDDDPEVEQMIDSFTTNPRFLHMDDSLNVASDGCIEVNVNRMGGERPVVVADEVVNVLKPHQIGGVRFLWENAVDSLEDFDDSEGFGCILAHSMGLGKTLQVVTFIELFLRETSARTAMVVSPVNTVENWRKEFHKWLRPETCPPVYLARDGRTWKERLQNVISWQETGGVLIVGYEMLRRLALGKEKRQSSASLQQRIGDLMNEDIELTEAQKMLLDPGAELVVCDEGHRIKNEKAGISQILKRMKTKRRVVLTGSPLQNNLEEYWCMVDFVRPSHLGTLEQFRNMFVNPIMNGTCLDSSKEDVKLMKYRTFVLYRMLTGFVQRRDGTLLTDSLPNKSEYVIPVRLTGFQEAIYKKMLEVMRQETTGKGKLFRAYSTASMIWNHPDCLYHVSMKKKPIEEEIYLEYERKRDAIVVKQRNFEAEITRVRNEYTSAVDRYRRAMTPDEQRRSMAEINTKRDQYNELVKENEILAENLKNVSATAPPKPKKRTADYTWAKEFLTQINYKPNDLSKGSKFRILFAMLQMAAQLRERILVFTQSISTLDLIEHLFAVKKYMIPGTNNEVWQKGKHYFRLDGSTSAADRAKMIEEFNDRSNLDIHAFFISTKAGSLGISLTAASRVVILDTSWNPSHDAQAVCRIYRYGQARQCFIYRLVTAGTMEETIYNRQVTKVGLSNRVVDTENPERLFTVDQLGQLFEYQRPPMMPVEKDVSGGRDPILGKLCDPQSTNNKFLAKAPFLHSSLFEENEEDENLSSCEQEDALRRYVKDKIEAESGVESSSLMGSIPQQQSQVPPQGFASVSGNLGAPTATTSLANGVVAGMHVPAQHQVHGYGVPTTGSPAYPFPPSYPFSQLSPAPHGQQQPFPVQATSAPPTPSFPSQQQYNPFFNQIPPSFQQQQQQQQSSSVPMASVAQATTTSHAAPPSLVLPASTGLGSHQSLQHRVMYSHHQGQQQPQAQPQAQPQTQIEGGIARTNSVQNDVINGVTTNAPAQAWMPTSSALASMPSSDSQQNTAVQAIPAHSAQESTPLPTSSSQPATVATATSAANSEDKGSQQGQ